MAGVRAARLLSWQERVALLRDMARWEAALLAGLQVLRAASARPAPSAQDPGRPLPQVLQACAIATPACTGAFWLVVRVFPSHLSFPAGSGPYTALCLLQATVKHMCTTVEGTIYVNTVALQQAVVSLSCYSA